MNDRTSAADIITPRLTLRKWRAEDLDSLHALWTDAEVRRFLWDGEVISRRRAAEVLKAGIESFGREGFGFWGVFESGSDRLIGFCGLRRIEESEDVELLYGIHPRVWGRGYATEAARAVLRWAFEATQLQRIFAGADPPNRASLRVMEKLGMSFTDNRRSSAGEIPYWSVSRPEFLSRKGDRSIFLTARDASEK